jgi:nucleoside-diphosphate-sugar epimerase
MRVLITGNMGYVGPALTRLLRRKYPDAELIGYDAGFFGHALTGTTVLPEIALSRQVFGDTRKFNPALLEGVDAVVHMAAISNDPMGNEFEQVTNDVNRQASVEIARSASNAGVKNFVFASSCSMYGAANGGLRKETDPTNPLTTYAKSKIGTENDLREADLGDMIFTSLRFATACGMSDRLRLDLVLNDFVACALSTGEITVLSDGSPWRPLIDVEDMGRAIDWAMSRSADNGGRWLAVNAGKSANNYQVKGLAEAVQRHIPGTKVSINAVAPPDRRSYQVDFSLFESLAPNYLPKVTLDTSIARLVEGLKAMGFRDRDFRNSSLMRLNMLRNHLSSGRLDKALYWVA